MVDVFTRECLAIEVDASLPGQRVVRVLDTPARTQGRPLAITVDNGPEFIGAAHDRWAFENGVELRLIQPGKPVHNAFVESFNDRFRDECLAEAHWTTMARARAEIERWRVDYNTVRPHSSLGYQTPVTFRQAWVASRGAGEITMIDVKKKGPDVPTHSRNPRT